MSKLTGAEIVVACLKEQGVDTVFGYPGGAILNIYDALYQHRDEITHILTSHEQGASHAADGYARATGKVGVCLATSGPGATNLVTGIATAYMDSVPVVRAIEDNGGVVVCFENCSGMKPLDPIDEDNPDVYDALARKYLNIGCSCIPLCQFPAAAALLAPGLVLVFPGRDIDISGLYIFLQLLHQAMGEDCLCVDIFHVGSLLIFITLKEAKPAFVSAAHITPCRRR